MAPAPISSPDTLFMSQTQESQDLDDAIPATAPLEDDLFEDLYEDPYEYDEFLDKSANPRFPSRMTARDRRRSISDSRE